MLFRHVKYNPFRSVFSSVISETYLLYRVVQAVRDSISRAAYTVAGYVSFIP